MVNHIRTPEPELVPFRTGMDENLVEAGHQKAPRPEFISIPEWSRRMGISKDSAYKAARLGEIPGCFSIGRLWRVNWTAFVELSAVAASRQPA